MTVRLLIVGTIITAFASCAQQEKVVTRDLKQPLTEFSNLYSDPTTESVYSKHVNDTFKIFKSLPRGYSSDSARKYPVIIILDANAFFESVVTELKFSSFIGQVPKSIVIGVGYKDFPTMDSLRTRDFTYPTAIPEYEMALSGGANKFKRFIDNELLPKLRSEHKIDLDRSVICGHSLGAYFTLFYALTSIEEKSFLIRNIVSASPSLHYNHRYLFELEKKLSKPANELSLNLYISMGSEDMVDDESKGILDAFEKQINDRKYRGLRLKKAEYSNFGHMDAAIPGFIKGLSYIFENELGEP
jgi:predicted alpha/beta superfamily hydrolase